MPKRLITFERTGADNGQQAQPSIHRRQPDQNLEHCCRSHLVRSNCGRRGWLLARSSRDSGASEISVNGGAGDTQHLRDVGGHNALVPQAARSSGIGVVDLAGPSALAPVGGSSSQPCTGALDHGVAFKLGEGGHDGQHRRAHGPVGVQALGEAAEPDPARGELLDNGQDVLGVATQAVELPDGEHVTFAQMVQAGVEMRPGRGGAAGVVGEDALRAGLEKGVDLELGILVGGTDSRVPDDRHCRPPNVS